VEIIRDPNFIDSPTVKADPRILKSAIFAVALGSNLGAFSFTFSASLAGLLWVNILRQKGIVVRGRDFVKWNFMPIIFLTFISLCVVLFEIEFF
jgi:Na+/H+ antiporter NhaD/arsenite permease-like protein